MKCPLGRVAFLFDRSSITVGPRRPTVAHLSREHRLIVKIIGVDYTRLESVSTENIALQLSSGISRVISARVPHGHPKLKSISLHNRLRATW